MNKKLNIIVKNSALPKSTSSRSQIPEKRTQSLSRQSSKRLLPKRYISRPRKYFYEKCETSTMNKTDLYFFDRRNLTTFTKYSKEEKSNYTLGSKIRNLDTERSHQIISSKRKIIQKALENKNFEEFPENFKSEFPKNMPHHTIIKKSTELVKSERKCKSPTRLQPFSFSTQRNTTESLLPYIKSIKKISKNFYSLLPQLGYGEPHKSIFTQKITEFLSLESILSICESQRKLPDFRVWFPTIVQAFFTTFNCLNILSREAAQTYKIVDKILTNIFKQFIVPQKNEEKISLLNEKIEELNNQIILNKRNDKILIEKLKNEIDHLKNSSKASDFESYKEEQFIFVKDLKADFSKLLIQRDNGIVRANFNLSLLQSKLIFNL